MEDITSNELKWYFDLPFYDENTSKGVLPSAAFILTGLGWSLSEETVPEGLRAFLKSTMHHISCILTAGEWSSQFLALLKQ